MGLNGSKSFVSFWKRLFEMSKGVLILYAILILFCLISGSREVALLTAIIIVVKIPVIYKRSRYHLLYFLEYEHHVRIVYMDFGTLRSQLISRDEVVVSIEFFQSRDTGFYLFVSKGKKRLLRTVDSFGWTVRNFLEVVKRIHGNVPNHWYFQEKYLSKYLGEQGRN